MINGTFNISTLYVLILLVCDKKINIAVTTNCDITIIGPTPIVGKYFLLFINTLLSYFILKQHPISS